MCHGIVHCINIYIHHAKKTLTIIFHFFAPIYFQCMHVSGIRYSVKVWISMSQIESFFYKHIFKLISLPRSFIHTSDRTHLNIHVSFQLDSISVSYVLPVCVHCVWIFAEFFFPFGNLFHFCYHRPRYLKWLQYLT